MGFTEKQQHIVAHGRGSLLVSAAAGSGKTSTLVAHVVRRLREGGDLGRLIIVTYTRAAAGEMRERIRLALEEALNETPHDRHLRHQLALLGQARIQTVDSLCNRLVRSHFELTDGLSPDLRIAEEAELKLLSQDVLDAVLEEAYAGGSADFYALLDGYGSEKGHEAIREMILTLYDSSQNAPFPETWLEHALPPIPQTAAELAAMPWMRRYTRQMKETICFLAERQDALIRELSAEPEAHGAFLSLLAEERETTRAWEALDDYYALQRALRDFKPAQLKKKEYKQDPSYDYIKEKRGGLTIGGYYSLLAPWRKGPFIDADEELRLMALTEAPGRALVQLTKQFVSKLGEACRARGIASFMDMEHFALNLLVKQEETERFLSGPDSPEKETERFLSEPVSAQKETDRCISEPDSPQKETVRCISAELVSPQEETDRCLPTKLACLQEETERFLSEPSHPQKETDRFLSGPLNIQKETVRCISAELASPQKETDRCISGPDHLQKETERFLSDPSNMQKETERFLLADPARTQEETERFLPKPSYPQKETERFLSGPSYLQKETERFLSDPSDPQKETERFLPTELARTLAAGLDEIIVDEYQDINQVQESILLALSGETAGRPNLFMVGDVKQSIYRFRRADPGIFMRKYAEFSEDAAAPHRKILLQDNFRSRPAVLESANRLFARVMSASFGGVDYDESVALHAAARFEGPDPETRVLLLESDDSSEQRQRNEARLIASQIRALIDEKRPIREKRQDGFVTRPISYGDIVILSRSLKSGAVLARTLKDYGIPAVAQESKGFYDTLEVQTLLSLLAVLDNPRQDIPLSAVMLSPIGGFTHEEMAELETRSRDASGDLPQPRTLLSRLTALPPETLDGRPAAFLAKLERWRGAARVRSVPELLDYLLEESGYGLYLAAMPSGPVRLANLRQLQEMAAAYEESSYKGLYQFLRYVERQKDLQVDVSEAPLLSDGADVVRIGTMHSSKGLEYPVVFLAGLGRKFNEVELSGSVLVHAELGLALMSCDPEAAMRCPSLERRFVSETIRREGRAEELRLLYVGMTRAMEQLILVGSLKDDLETACEKLADTPPEETNCFLDWLLQCRAAGDDLGMRWETFTPADIPAPQTLSGLAQLDRWSRLKEGKEASDDASLRALRPQLDWQYPYASLPRLSFSVSELKKAGEAGETAPAPRRSRVNIPEDPEPLTAAEKGTAFHKLMEHIPPEEAETPASVDAFIERAIARGLFSPAEAASLDVEAVCAFYTHPIGRRAAKAAQEGRLRREKPFLLGLPYHEIDPDSPLDETVLVQGIIDMYFEEDGRLVLIDYKTDRVRDPRELAGRYKAQLAYYRRALSAAAGLPVGEVWIYAAAARTFVAL